MWHTKVVKLSVDQKVRHEHFGVTKIVQHILESVPVAIEKDRSAGCNSILIPRIRNQLSQHRIWIRLQERLGSAVDLDSHI